MGEYGSLALTGAVVPLQTAGYNRLVIQAAKSVRFSNNKADASNGSSPNTFNIMANASGDFEQFTLFGNLAETIWFDADSAVTLYYILT